MTSEPDREGGGAHGPRDAISTAWAGLTSLDIRELAMRAKAEILDADSAVVTFLGKRHEIRRSMKSVSREDGTGPTNPFVAALILHYLIGAKDVDETGKLLTFRELPGGEIYYRAFHRRAIQPVAEAIGPTPMLLNKRAERVGGERMGLGDASVKIRVFPRVPVVVVVWRGDEEVPSSANILFDSTASYHLPTEDLAAVGDLVADALVLSDEQWRGW